MTGVSYSKPRTDEWSVEYQFGKGWFVLTPAGVAHDGPYANRNAALAAARTAPTRAARQAKCIERPCMRCGTIFPSEGVHNRMCGRCRHAGSAEGDPVGYSFGAMTGRRR